MGQLWWNLQSVHLLLVCRDEEGISNKNKLALARTSV